MARAIKNPSEALFSRWSKKVAEIVGEDNVSFGVSSQVANDKAVFARMFVMGNTSGTLDLQNNEISTNLAVQCEAYSTVGLSKALEIDEVSHEAMLAMGFHRTYGEDITENSESSIKKIISRYRRTYTGYFPDEAMYHDIIKDNGGDPIIENDNNYILTKHKKEE